MTNDNIIDLQDVGKRFGSFTAVSNLTLSLKAGEFFSLLGPSGCGKTTALRMIAGFQEPTSGRILIDGQDMAGVPANKRPTNMVFQSYAIFPHLNVGDNVAYGLRSRGLSKAEISTRVVEALSMVELQGFEKRRAGELSGGQRQRVALARALIMRPKVLLLDEPLSALDKRLREQMQFELRRLQRSLGITFVMVTHDQYEAMIMSDRIGVMFDGRLVQVDRPEDIYARPANTKVATFIGGMSLLPARLIAQTAAKMVLELPAFGQVEVAKNTTVTTRTSHILVGIRPEQIEIATEQPVDSQARTSGEVIDVAFYGETVHYHVRVDGVEKPIAASVPNYFHTVDYRPGDRVWLGVQGASVIDLGSDESNNLQGD